MGNVDSFGWADWFRVGKIFRWLPFEQIGSLLIQQRLADGTAAPIL
jgi:hypothetical protein